MATSSFQNDSITTEIPTNSIVTKSSPQNKTVPTSTLFLLSNICNLVPLRLDSTNYVLWKYQVSFILKSHSLFGHIDDSLPCPPKFLPSSATETNPEYLHGSSVTKPSSPSSTPPYHPLLCSCRWI
uniref:Retrotransposon Copia-like N-terminal domain-containing protein n=1 Tax=Cucumis melo TaxID=3656 RepID=A0A9I9E793_CUCME